MKEKTRRMPYTVLLPNNYYVHIDESIRYDIRLVMENENKTIIEKFVDEIYPELNIKAPKIKTEYKKATANNFLCNLIKANKKNKLVAISRRPETYSNCASYGLEYCTYRFITGIADAFIEKDYAGQWMGYYDKNKKDRKGNENVGYTIIIESFQ